MQSSGLPSLDESVLRAVSRVSNFGPLPSDWERDKISVLFWFDYKAKPNECTAEDYLKSSKGENGLRVWPEEGPKVSLGSNQMFRVIGTALVTIPRWSVEGEQCKANDCGSVSVMGLYSAPRAMPPNPEIVLKVQEKTQPCRTGTTRLTLIPEGGR